MGMPLCALGGTNQQSLENNRQCYNRTLNFQIILLAAYFILSHFLHIYTSGVSQNMNTLRSYLIDHLGKIEILSFAVIKNSIRRELLWQVTLMGLQPQNWFMSWYKSLYIVEFPSMSCLKLRGNLIRVECGIKWWEVCFLEGITFCLLTMYCADLLWSVSRSSIKKAWGCTVMRKFPSPSQSM